MGNFQSIMFSSAILVNIEDLKRYRFWLAEESVHDINGDGKQNSLTKYGYVYMVRICYLNFLYHLFTTCKITLEMF